MVETLCSLKTHKKRGILPFHGDEGRTLGSLILAYLVFGPGRASTDRMARPINMIEWYSPGARLGV
jgi:hypothetical protein